MKILRFLSFILIKTTLFPSLTANAKSQQISVYINTDKQNYDIHPIIINNSVLVPIHPIFKSFNADFSYQLSSKTINASLNQTII